MKASDVKLPPNTKNLPPAAQAAYRKGAAATGRFTDGWVAVKEQFERDDNGKWVKKKGNG